MFNRFSSVVMIEAGKQIYAPTAVRAVPAPAKRLRPQPAIGIGSPAPGRTAVSLDIR